MKFVIVALALLFVGQAYAGLSFGKCPESPVLADFDATKYVGKWYEIERISGPYEANLKCVNAQYAIREDGKLSVKNQGINTKTGEVSGIEGFASAPNANEPNKLKVTFPISVSIIKFNTNGKYDVWETDYSSYALVYSCTQAVPSVLKYENMWVLSRTPTLDQTLVDSLKNKLKGAKINIAPFETIPQDC